MFQVLLSLRLHMFSCLSSVCFMALQLSFVPTTVNYSPLLSNTHSVRTKKVIIIFSSATSLLLNFTYTTNIMLA